YFFALIQLCADIDGRVMVIGSPKQRNVVEPLTYNQAWEYARETFAECADFAQEKGVVLCMEPLSSQQTNFINTPAEAVRMVKAVDNPNFQIILDVTSTAAEKLDMPTQVREFAQYVAHFHSNDDNGYLPGSGNVDYPPIIEALKEIHYAGYLSTEVFNFEPDAETIARRSIAFLKSLV
ncbi:sugar phosphate isomerase/epimerase, partial [Candidatus Poribacteria bacterium]|nr:sugar phosphate isomerase/epimerase [Candidatus Poribacteria bacterium]